jgi:hypothetical protein
MKKLLLVATAILWQFTAHAQDFRFGVKGGANFADIAGKDLDENSHRYKLGWHAGVMVNIQNSTNKVFSIQPELLYSRKGYENNSLPVEIRNSNNNLLYSQQEGGLVRLNYLDLPVIFNFKVGIIVFEVGPQVSYLVGMENEATIKHTFPDGSELTLPSSGRYEKEEVKKFDAGIATGFRLETANGVGFGLRFNQGFIKLPKDDTIPKPGSPFVPSGFNQSFQLFASYLIPE